MIKPACMIIFTACFYPTQKMPHLKLMAVKHIL